MDGMGRPSWRRGRRFPIAALLLGMGLVLGCRADPGPMQPPETELARASLAKALGAWKAAGRRTEGGLIGSAPKVGLVDTAQRERPLADFEILGPLFPLAEARPFAVRLTLDSPREVVPARYVVLGSDPIWVFRHEDYQLILHWEHKMTPGEIEGEPTPARAHPAPEAH